MRDGVKLERLGMPVVTVLPEHYQQIARGQAVVEGLPDYTLVVIPGSIWADSPREVLAKTEQVAPQAAQKLLQR